MNKNCVRRWLAALTAFMMLVGMAPVSALADDSTESNTTQSNAQIASYKTVTVEWVSQDDTEVYEQKPYKVKDGVSAGALSSYLYESGYSYCPGYNVSEVVYNSTSYTLEDAAAVDLGKLTADVTVTVKCRKDTLGGRTGVLAVYIKNQKYNNYAILTAAAKDSHKLKAMYGYVDGDSFYTREDAPTWTFAQTGNNLYTVQAENGQYLSVTGSKDSGVVGLSDTPFSVYVEQDGNALHLLNKDTSNAVDLYGNNWETGFGTWAGQITDMNEKFMLFGSVPQMATWMEPLNGKTVAIGFPSNGKVYTIQDTALNANKLNAAETLLSSDGKVFAQDGQTTVWTFEAVDPANGFNFYVKSGSNYLKLTEGGISVTTDPFVITVEQIQNQDYLFITDSTVAAGNGKKASAANYSGKVTDGYNRGQYNTGASNQKLRLYEVTYTPPEGFLDLHGTTAALALLRNSKLVVLLQAENHWQAGRLLSREANLLNGQVSTQDGDVTLWHFEKVSENDYTNYYIQADNGKYLNITESAVSLSDDPVPVKVERYTMSDGSPAIRLMYNRTAANLYGNNVNNGFGAYAGNPSDNEKFRLYNVSDENTIHVSFDKNGGSENTQETTICYTNSMLTLPEYHGTKDGYIFLGWALKNSLQITYNNDSTNAVEVFPAGSQYALGEKDIKFYTAWTPDTPADVRFFIRMDGQIPSEPGDPGQALYLPPNNNNHPNTGMTKYQALKEQRWVVDQSLSGRELKGNHIVNAVTAQLTELPSDDDIKGIFPSYNPETQYVLWYVIKWMSPNWHVDGVILNRSDISIVTYNANSSRETVTNMPFGYQAATGSEIVIGLGADGELRTPSRNGYVFKGWCTTADGTGEFYKEGTTVTLNENLDLYAIWVNGLNELTVIKKNEKGTSLEGAAFLLEQKQANGQFGKMDRAVTGSEGTLTFGNLASNRIYRLTESTAPTGYESSDSFCFRITSKNNRVSISICDENGDAADKPSWLDLDSDASVTTEGKGYLKASFTITDDYILRKVRFVLKDRNNATPIAGAVYTLKEGNETVTGVLTEASDANGVFSADNALLHYGTYTLVEESAPDLYEAENVTFTLGEYVDQDNHGLTVKSGDATVTCEETVAEVDGTRLTTYLYTVTLTNEKMVKITGTKVWEDGGNRDGLRPEEITVQLLKGGKVIDKKVLKSSKYEGKDEWKFSFDEQPRYENGKLIEYTIAEVVEDSWADVYTSSVDQKNRVITNTYAFEVRDVQVTKVWDDDDDFGGIRPESVTVNLVAEGEEPLSAVLSEENNWTWTFEGVPKNVYGENGSEPVAYAVTEDEVENYKKPEIEQDEEGNFTVTNRPVTFSLKLSKLWDDDNNRDGVRPESITIRVYKNNESTPFREQSFSGSTGNSKTDAVWAMNFIDLPVFEAGQEISYRVEEEPIPKYLGFLEGQTFKNNHTPDTVGISGTVTWQDENAANRPDSVTLRLLADGEEIDSLTLNKTEFTGNSWSYKFKDQYKNKNVTGTSEPIVYTVTEDDVTGYRTEAEGYNFTNIGNTVTVTIRENSGKFVYNGQDRTVSGYTVSTAHPLYTENDFTFTGTDSVTGRNAGTYSMDLKPEDFTNTNEAYPNVKFVIEEGTLEITRRKVELVSGTSTRTYNRNALTNDTVTVSGDGFAEGEGADYQVTGTVTDVGIVNNAFSYDLHENTAAGNYEITKTEGTLTVTPVTGKITVTITGSKDSVLYNGQEQTGTGYAVSISNPLYRQDDFKYNGQATVTGKDVGSYLMGLKKDDFVNTNTNFSNVEFVVDDGRLDITSRKVTLTSASAERVYNGTALTNHDVTVGGDGFAEGEGAAYTVTGSRTDAGIAENAFTYELNENTNPANYEITTIPGQLTVKPVEARVTVKITGEKSTVKYDGKPHTADSYEVTSDNSLYQEANVAFNGTLQATRTNAGTTNMNLAASQFSNTSNNFTNVVFEVEDGWQKVERADVRVTITENSASYTYNGQEQSVTGYTPAANNDLYNLASDFTFKAQGHDRAAGTTVGTYPMELMADDFENNNNNFNAVFEVVNGSLVITPATAEVTITGHSAKNLYDRERHEATGYDFVSTNPVYTAADFEYSGTAVAGGTDAGTYSMNLAAGNFSNTNPNFENVTFTVDKDGFQTIEPIDVSVTVEGTKSTDTYDGTEHTSIGFSTEASSRLYDATKDLAFSGTAKAARTVEGTTVMGLEPAQFTNTNGNFAKVSVTTKDGSETIVPVGNVVVTIAGNKVDGVYNGEEQEASGYEVVQISDPLYTADDFTFKGTALASGTDADTYKMGLTSEQFENTNPNFTNVTFNVTDGELNIAPLAVKVTITGHTATNPYDGKTHEAEGYDVTADSDLYREEYITGPAATRVGGINAGTYPMNLKADDFTSNNDNFAPTFEVKDGGQTITPIDVTVKVTGDQAATDYDAAEHTVTGYTAEAIESELYNPDTDLEFIGKTEPTASRTDEGTSYMGLTKEQFRNTNSNFANVTIEVDDGYQTIRPIPAKVTITGNNSTLPYDGTAHTVSGYTATTTSTLYNVADIALDGAATATRTKKGTTPMGLTPEKFSNTNGNFYPVTFEVTDGYQTIAPIDVTVTVTGHTSSVAYDGKSHTATGYDLEFSNDLYTEDDIRFTGKNSVTRTDAGTTNMGLDASQFTNVNDNFGTVTFVVAKDGFQEITALPVTVTIKENSASFVYDGEEHTVTGYTATADKKLYNPDTELTLKAQDKNSVKGTVAGTYNMELTAEDFENKNQNFAVTFAEIVDGALTITPATANVTITGHTGKVPYDGQPHNVSGYTAEIDNKLYTEADFEYSGTTEAGGTDAATYPMNLDAAKFSNTNPNFAGVTFTVKEDGYQKIDPIDVKVTIVGDYNTASFDGTEHAVSGYKADADNELYNVKNDFTFTGDAKAARMEEGTTKMGLTKDQFSNDNPNFGTVEFDVTDGYQTIVAKDKVVVTITGHSNSVTYNGEEQRVAGYDVKISDPLYTENDFTFSETAALAAGTDAGTYAMGLKAGQFENTNRNFKDVTFLVTDGELTIKPLDVTVTITGHTATSPYDGETHEAEGYDVTSSSDLYKEEYITGPTATKVGGVNANTYPMGLKSEQFGNTNKNFGDVTFLVTDGWQKITPISATITITGRHDEQPYDGEEHTVTGYDIDRSTELYNPETDMVVSEEVLATATQKNAGTAYMGLKKEQFANISTNFEPVTFVVHDGYQTIEPAGITVTVEGAQAEADYDGQAHEAAGYTATANNELYDPENDLAFNGTDAVSGTNADSYPMGLTEENFRNTNNNFTIENLVIHDGGVTINRIPAVVTIRENSAAPVYDGTEKTVTGYTVKDISTELYQEADFTVKEEAAVTVSGTDAGTYELGLTAEDFVNGNDNFSDVTFVIEDGALVIAPAEVTVTTGTDEKYYDGTELTSGEASIEGLIGEESVQIKATGTQTEVGQSYNTYDIVWDNAKETNYTVVENMGILTVKPELTGLAVVSGTNTWIDEDDADGLRPESITVNLLADGRKVASQKVTAENDWSYTFADLEQYLHNRLIEYSITAETVDGYVTAVSGFDLTHVHVRERISVSGYTVWADDSNAAKDRPAASQVTLLANGTAVATAEVSAASNVQSYSFTDLPRYENGEKIVYTVAGSEADKYKTTVVGYNIYYVRQKETAQKFKLTVHYLADGQKVFEDSVHTYTYGTKYNVVSPKKTGYTADRAVVEGVISEDTEVNVTYTRDQYSLTVFYLYQDGTTAASTYTATLYAGDSYDVISPEVAGYKVNHATVAGTMPGHDVQRVVLYTARQDVNARVSRNTAMSTNKSYDIIEDYDTARGVGGITRGPGETID